MDRSQTRLTGMDTSSPTNSLSSIHDTFSKQPAPLVLPLPTFRGFPFLLKVGDIDIDSFENQKLFKQKTSLLETYS